MTTKGKFTLFSLFIAGALLFASCESDSPSQSDQENQSEENALNEEDSNKEIQRENITKIFYSIPSPVEMSSLIQESGEGFDESLMNSTDNVKAYNSLQAQAIALGVYGADISYAGMFEQNQTTVNYLSSIQSLTNSLGMSSVLDNDLLDRMNSNKSNKDSLISIASETYWTFNGYLKEDNREDIASLIIAGGWVEGLHLALAHCESNEGDLALRVAEQKHSLKNLLALMDSKKTDKSAGVIEDLYKISTVYDQVMITREQADNKVNENGVMELNSTNTVEMSEETLAELKSLVSEIRENYIH